MTTPAKRILAVLVLGMAGVTLPIPGEGLSRETARTGKLADRFSFGFLGGVNQTPYEDQSIEREIQTIHWWNQREGWLVGGFVELDLGTRFSVQAGLSYVHAYMWETIVLTQDTLEASPGPAEFMYQVNKSSLELPVTLNYRMGSAKWRPVIGAGPAFRSQLYGGSYGAVALFGVEGRMGQRWTLAPQVRYFRWVPGDAYLSGPRNRVQALVVVTF